MEGKKQVTTKFLVSASHHSHIKRLPSQTFGFRTRPDDDETMELFVQLEHIKTIFYQT